LSAWSHSQAFWLDALGLERWDLRTSRTDQTRPLPPPDLLLPAAVAKAAASSATLQVGLSYSGATQPRWVMVGLSSELQAFFSDKLGSRILRELKIEPAQCAYLIPASHAAPAVELDLTALEAVACLGAPAQAWLLQQGQFNTLGTEAKLSIQHLLCWPDLTALQGAEGKRALWQTWTAYLRKRLV